jgi:hypothetical protein
MLELISVHIPKTAGTSFAKVLKRHYAHQILFFYRRYLPNVDFMEKLEENPETRALRGHFPLRLFKEEYPDAKTVIWFRHPVERIISYYYYWLSIEPPGNPNHDSFLTKNQSIVDLAKILSSEVPSYLEGYSVRKLDFIGVVEHFKEDVKRFERWLTVESTNSSSNLFKALTRRIIQSWHKRIPYAKRNKHKKRVPQDVR